MEGSDQLRELFTAQRPLDERIDVPKPYGFEMHLMAR